MRKSIATLVGAAVLTLVLGVGSVWADAKIRITRERNDPESVEIKAGEEVEWINALGGTAHVWFGGNDAIRFYVGGKRGSRVKFDKPGTYEYTVHVTATKAHEHTGTIVVK
jgi:plastocyanin